MRKRNYIVNLNPEQQKELQGLCSKGKVAARSLRRAQILLWADENRDGGKLSDIEIAQRLNILTNSMYLVRKRYAEQGLQAAIERKMRLPPPSA
ncbi:helix-turn-helix domain-containing protein [Paenibacillus apiarius]|uniref:helix-turn-helix domain-containing protein n=1 Tax=Paenibacillus apiarius TaxID=46240 RepID=UPI00197D1758|nr:helix-turn-helix domain-containing protein [Paenibacillus apiarius]MBN3527213.1 helix-turn-helix domain-containing protein [Paenibacillus apiarius]